MNVFLGAVQTSHFGSGGGETFFFNVFFIAFHKANYVNKNLKEISLH